MAGVTTSKKFVCTRQAKTSKSTGQLQRGLVGGLRAAARRVGLAMTDQELLPTARNITDNLERKADRNRRGIEALMTRLEAELGHQRPQKKGESLEMFFVSNKLQRKRGERITDYITRFEEGIKTLQDNDINLRCARLDADEKGELDTGAARTFDCRVTR